jgi:hypothetical protein
MGVGLRPPPGPEKTVCPCGVRGAVTRGAPVYRVELPGILKFVKVDDLPRSVGTDDLPGPVKVKDHSVAVVREGLLSGGREGLLSGLLAPFLRRHVALGTINSSLWLGLERTRQLAGTLFVWFLNTVVPHDEPL